MSVFGVNTDTGYILLKVGAECSPGVGQDLIAENAHVPWENRVW